MSSVRDDCGTSSTVAASYDEVPYESGPFSYTHPDALASVATLYGMTPPDVERARVLELGCAEGGNLIPVALSLPNGRFVGLDLSPRQIADGQSLIERLDLKNIELRTMDLMEVDRSFGQFDYIVCHGVFSWVPRPVQDKILAICAEHLAPQGVAYLSYNTYPGWHSRGMVREMVRYHVDADAPPRERVRQARDFLDFLVRNSRDPKSVYSHVLHQEQLLWQKESDSYVLHEQLTEVNDPLYFHQFAARLADYRLQYITEAKLSESAATPPEEVSQKLAGCQDDLVRYEQHIDFLRERTFRRSLLCHADVRLNRSPPAELAGRFLFAARAIPVSDESNSAAPPQQFRTNDGISFSTNNRWLQAALFGLFELWPRLLSFEELCCQARYQLGQWETDSPEAQLDPAEDAALLKQPLVECGRTGLVELHVHRSPEIADISERPRASPLARIQAESSSKVTSWRHRQLELNDFDRRLLPLLDGSRTQAELLDALQALVASGKLTLPAADGDSTPLPDRLGVVLFDCLRRFAGGGLLDG